MSLSVPIVDVGTPSPEFQGWERAEVRFHGFAELPAESGLYEESFEFTCLGRQWTLDIYPGGDIESDEGMVALDLNNMSNKGIHTKFRFSIKDSDGRYRETAYAHNSYKFEGLDVEGDDNEERIWCNVNFVKRSTILKYLVEGTLVIEVQMRLATKPVETIPPPFIPVNPAACNAIQKNIHG